MQRSPKGTALVTGASGGIGLELARLLARDHYNLVLVARNETKLAAVAGELRRHGVKVQTVACDLALPNTPRRIWNELEATSTPIDILINNAGFGTYGPFSETGLDAELRMIAVNIAALTHLTKLVLPSMLARRRGRILNVASTAAFQPGPLMAVYYASKAYVLSLSEALWNELEGTGVSVTALCPGPTRSDFQEQAKMQDSRLVQGMLMDAPTVALLGYRGLLRRRRIVIPGIHNQAFGVLSKFLPRAMVLRIVRRAQERT